MKKKILFVLVVLISLTPIVNAQTKILSPSSEIVDGGLVIHKPDKYFDEDTGEWVYADITDVINMSFNSSSGDIKYSYKDDKYYAISRLFFVVNLTQSSCEVQGWNWYDNHCYLWYNQAKQFMEDKNIDYGVVITKHDYYWKYALNLSAIPQNYAEKILYVGLHLENVSSNLNWDDVKIRSGKLIVKNKIALTFDDLLESGYNVRLYDKRTVLIGNVRNKTSLWLDPSLEIDGTVTELFGEKEYTYVIVKNSGTLRIADINGTLGTGELYLKITKNLTVDSTSWIDGKGRGCAGGSGGVDQSDGTTGNCSGGGTGGGGGNPITCVAGGGGGGAYGGNGGGGGGGVSVSCGSGSGGTAYGSSDGNSTRCGSGGGGGGASFSSGGNAPAGGDAGGNLTVECLTSTCFIHIEGAVNVSGNAGDNGGESGGGGGGAGGGITLLADTINITNAVLWAKGGNGGGGSATAGGAGGGGGGGRIKILYTTLNGNSSATKNVTYGLAGTPSGTPASDGSIGTTFYNNTYFTDYEWEDPPSWSNNVTSVSSPTEYNPDRNYGFEVEWSSLDSNGYNVSLIEHNFTSTLTNYTTTRSGNVSYYNFTGIPAGYYNFKFYANASNNKWNSTDTWYFNVTKNTTNTLHINVTVRGTTYTDSDVEVQTDGSVKTECYLEYSQSGTCSLYYDEGSVTSPDTRTHAEGSHTYLSNSTGNANYTSDLTGLSITITSTYEAAVGGGGGGGSPTPREVIEYVCEKGYYYNITTEECLPLPLEELEVKPLIFELESKFLEPMIGPISLFHIVLIGIGLTAVTGFKKGKFKRRKK